MLPELTIVTALAGAMRSRLAAAREQHRLNPDAGYSTEAVVATALLAALAIAVIGIIATKVRAKANGINLG